MSSNPFTWSYSALKDYVNCPRQYHQVRVIKQYTKPPSQQMLYGKEIHKALEDYAREGKPLLKNYEVYKPVMDALLDNPGAKYPEYEMALTLDKEPCAFSDSNRWVRGIADLLIIDGDHAFIVDYKTGSDRYPDLKQLKLMALMTFAHFPEVNFIKAGLLFVVRNSFVDESYERKDIDALWQSFDKDLERLQISLETDIWNPNPTPLCGWCPVKTCEYHRPRK